MKSRAIIALLLLFLWTVVPGLGAACGGSNSKPTCPQEMSCDCCSADEACLCASTAPTKNERPVALSSPELKLPLVLPSETMWETASVVLLPVTPRFTEPFTLRPVVTADVQTRFCTFLL